MVKVELQAGVFKMREKLPLTGDQTTSNPQPCGETAHIHHKPVLIKEFLEFFADQDLKVFVDGTLGAGGHAMALLECHPEIEHYIGIDQDSEALSIARKHLGRWSDKIHFYQGSFSSFDSYLETLKISYVDGMLLDLGVSSMQLDQPEKGFSFLREGPLDMRMNAENTLTAADILNQSTERELGRIFCDYGEETHWKLAARKVVAQRKISTFRTTTDLCNCLDPVLRPWSKRKHHPLTLIFQALRIAVNSELELLQKTLPKTIERLGEGGRLAIISFHSLEDRLVKDFFRYASTGRNEKILSEPDKPTVKLLTKKPVVPDTIEIQDNPRSRSSRMRVVEKL